MLVSTVIFFDNALQFLLYFINAALQLLALVNRRTFRDEFY